MGKLTRFIGIMCAAILACYVNVSAKTVINETFDNTTVSGVMGAGKLFTSGTSASTSDVSIEAEENGNKYFQLKQSSSQKVLLTSSGIMDDVTTISARMKFNGGNTTGLILRNGSNQFYIAVNNGGGSVLRLFNDASTALTIDYNKWYDVFYKIDFNANTIYGSIKPVGSVSGVENTVALNSAVTKNSHIRIISDGTTSAPSKGVCIDKLIVGDRYEPSYFVNETFDNYNTGNVNNASFAPEAGFSLTATSFFANTSIVESEQGKSLKVTGTKNIAEPLVYTTLVPNGKSILSFDAKASELTNEFRAFIQTNASNRLNIMQFYNSTDSSVADFVSVLGHQDKYLGEKIKSEYVNFTYVIEKGNGQTTISGYVNGEYFGTKTLGVDYTSVRFDLNAGGIPDGVDGTKTVMYLDNYKFYQPGATEVSVEIPEYITNGDYVTLKANNFINPDTLSFNCPEGVTVTPEIVDGKEYKLVFDGLRKNQNYTITAGNICDLYGQSFSVPAISFESIPAPLVEAETSYKLDGMPCLNGKFAPGKLDVAFTAMSNTDQDIKTTGYIALYGEDEKVLLGVKAVDIVVPARGNVTIPADITITDDVKKVGVFIWYEDMSPVCDADALLPYTYEEIESVEVYYPGHTNKAVTFSYDDGIFGTDEILINLFNKYNLKGTFNIVGSFIPEDEAELAKYQALYEGHEIANHSMTHPRINVESDGVTIQMATDDILACREKLEAVFGDAFDSDKWGFVWPYARPVGRNPETDIPFVTQLEQNIKNMGAVYIRPVTTTGKFDLPSDWMLWEPTSKDDNMEEYTDAFLADSESGLRLLYLWGHSTDLSSKKCGKGFADLEATFKKLTDEGVNIWSATNMEIYDYIHAVEDIEVSEDKTKVINSSDVDVYAVINGQKVVIPANGYTAL